MSSTYQEYKNRVTFKGSTKREYVKNKVKESIDSLIYDSQYGFKIKVNDEEHDAAILSTTTTQEYEAANVIAHLGFLEKGTVFAWENSDWIVLKKMFRPDQPGFNGIAYKCTDSLKWIDETGQLNAQPAYIRSGRITNALGVTPDKNEFFDNIILHTTDWNMMAATPLNLKLQTEMRFIVKGQSYRVSNIDNVSVEGVSILSMVSDKLLDSDDLVEGVAGRSNYSIDLGVETPIQLKVGESFELPVVVYKEGVLVNESFTLLSSNDFIRIEGNMLIGTAVGESTISCYLDKNPLVVKTAPIIISEEVIENVEKIVIVGKDYILWNSTEEYSLFDGRDASFAIETSSKIKKEIIFENNKVLISIKDKYVGSMIITAVDIEGHTYTKEIIIKTN